MARHRIEIARVESRAKSADDTLHGQRPLTADFLAELARTYDPNYRTAKVLSGWHPSGVSGPAHIVGEHLPPLGNVLSVDFDGQRLFAEIEEIKGRVTEWVEDGFDQRSVAFARFNPEIQAPYLFHVALLSGEVPGVSDMPALDLTKTVQLTGGQTIELEMRTMSTKPAGETPKSEDKGAQPAAPAPAAPPPEPENRSATAPASSPSTPAAEPSAAPQAPDFAPVMRTLEGVAATMQTLATQLQARPAPADDTSALVAELRAERQKQRETDLVARLEQCVRGGRLTAAAHPEVLSVISDTSIPFEVRSKRVEAYEQREPGSLFRSHEIRVGEGDGAFRLDMQRFALEGIPMLPGSLNVYRSACQAAGGPLTKENRSAWEAAARRSWRIPSATEVSADFFGGSGFNGAVELMAGASLEGRAAPFIEQVQGIDPVLTDLVLGEESFLQLPGEQILPAVAAPAWTFKFPTHGSEHLKLVDAERAFRTEIKEVGWTITYQTKTLRHFAMGSLLDVHEIDNATPPLDAAATSAFVAREAVRMWLEKIRADKLTTAANYAAGHSTTLLAGSEWDAAGGDSKADIDVAAAKIFSATNYQKSMLSVFLGGGTLAAAQADPVMRTHMKNRGIIGEATLDMLAQYWGVREVISGDVAYLDDADVRQQMWPDDAIVFYRGGDPKFDRLRGERVFAVRFKGRAPAGISTAPIQLPKKTSVFYPWFDWELVEILSTVSGYIIKNCSAAI